MCGDRAEQDEVPDVLSVGVALGDAGMRYDSSFSRFYQRKKEKIYIYTGARERKTEKKQHMDPEIQRCVFVCSCVLRKGHL